MFLTAAICWLCSARDNLAQTAPSTNPAVIWTYDARPLRKLDLHGPSDARQVWDTMHLLAGLQGLVNRDSARLYVLFCQEFGVDTDSFWLEWLRREDGWLRNATVQSCAHVEDLLDAFREDVNGLVVYDGRVPATSAVASTVAGIERLLPVRYDAATNSVFARLTTVKRLPVKVWLVNSNGTPLFTGRGELPGMQLQSSGSAKLDVYRWAIERYLRPGRCGPGVAAYYLDAFWLSRPTAADSDMHTLSNHDWFIARKAFFFDLSPWADEAPVDDREQRVGGDRECLLQILRLLQQNAADRMVRIGGFPPWPFKYTTHAGAGRHEPVATEWEFTRLISQFNSFKEADAAGLGAMANASFFQHYPLRSHYRQPNPKPARREWTERGFMTVDGRVKPRLYVGQYVGDYDSPSWLYKAVPAFFSVARLGQVPLGWAFNPNLADRAPQALVYAYGHASSNDFFIAGDSGAGYVNPRGLSVRPESHLSSGLEIWTEHCRPYFARWDMSITGFMLDGGAGASTDREFAAYRVFSPDGAGTHFEAGPALHAGLPTCPERDLPDSSEAAAAVIAEAARATQGGVRFLWARSILKPPGWYADVSRRVAASSREAEVEFVDPYTFFGLIRIHLSR